MRGKKGGAMLSEFGAVEPVMFAYVYRFSFPGNMRVCGHWAGDWCSPCIGTGFDTLTFFFHEYGRRVGMVPRSSLKGGKNSQMVEKRTRTTKTTQNQTNHSPQAESPPSCSLSSVLGETSETKTNDVNGPEFQSPRKFFGTVNLATFAVPRSFVAQ